MSKRVNRVGSAIRAIVAAAIQNDLNDPRIPSITSVTRVEVSADFSVARVFVSVLAPDARRRACLRALASAAGHLRWLVGRELSLRKTPVLDFRLDESLRGSFETVQLIDRAMAELRPPAGAATDGEAGSGGPAPRDESDASAASDHEVLWEDT